MHGLFFWVYDPGSSIIAIVWLGVNSFRVLCQLYRLCVSFIPITVFHIVSYTVQTCWTGCVRMIRTVTEIACHCVI